MPDESEKPPVVVDRSLPCIWVKKVESSVDKTKETQIQVWGQTSKEAYETYKKVKEENE